MMKLRVLGNLVVIAGFVVACKPDEPKPPFNAAYPPPTAYNITSLPSFPGAIIKADNPLTVEGIELGRALFYDPVLSGDNTQSCASCHNPQFAFTDNGKVFSTGITGAIGTRNSMPLFNLMWNTRYFWDGRAATLREQVLMPIEDPTEMHENLPNAIQKLVSIPAYKTRFGKAFGTEAVTPDRMAKALEQFIFAMVSGQSKFDLAMIGTSSLSPAEQRGLDIFRGEFSPPGSGRPAGGDCFHCHGTVFFTNNQFINNGLDSVFSDIGFEAVTNNVLDKGKFKVPSLRNVALSPPFMHDGRFATLEEVVEHYNSGIKSSLTLDNNMKSQGGGLGLTLQQKADLVAFLKTLSDTSYINNPLFQNPFTP